MSNIKLNTFKNKLKSLLWPIHKNEFNKFISMCGLMFCILFNQNILRILKDSILIAEINAEVVSFAKVYCVTPIAALFVIIYAKMLNHLSFEKIYYYLIFFFTGFFFLFAFIIYPNIHIFHINANTLLKIMKSYPHLQWYIALIGNWSYMVFYTLSELWPNIFYVLLFWQFANEFTTTEEAKRFYTLFSLFGNSSLIFAGFLMMNLSSESTFIKFFIKTSNSKIMLIKISISFVIIFTIISCLFVRLIVKNFYVKPSSCIKITSITNNMGLIESCKYIIKSKYLWLMLICSAAFGLSMNLVEAVWKSKIKELYPTVNSYAEFNSFYILWTGIAIMIMTMIGNYIMRKHGWLVAAIIPPIVMMITGIIFFLLIVFDFQVLQICTIKLIITPLALSVLVGAIQNILVKGTKYSLWDTSKEMLYIPLDHELKTKGKAAVDVISSKIGKSSSGLIQSIIFIITPTATFNSISPYLMIVFVIVCIVWIISVQKIYFEYKKII